MKKKEDFSASFNYVISCKAVTNIVLYVPTAIFGWLERFNEFEFQNFSAQIYKNFTLAKSNILQMFP